MERFCSLMSEISFLLSALRDALPILRHARQ
jgi:hypothetical protein